MLRVQASRMVWMLFALLSVFFTKPIGSNSVIGNSGGNSSGFMLMCNNETYNPAKATCCGNKTITGGLSENMSKCCGEKAFNPLNEICCNSVVRAKLSSNTSCCDKEAFDENKQMCCGNDKIVLTRLSPDHLCCVDDKYKSQYNEQLECCCPKHYPRVQLKVNGTRCCAKNIKNGHSSPNVHSTDEERKPGYFMNPSEVKGPNETVCSNGDRRETYLKQKGFKCCGHYYYNPSLWLCCKKRLISFYEHNLIFIFAGCV